MSLQTEFQPYPAPTLHNADPDLTRDAQGGSRAQLLAKRLLLLGLTLAAIFLLLQLLSSVTYGPHSGAPSEPALVAQPAAEFASWIGCSQANVLTANAIGRKHDARRLCTISRGLHAAAGEALARFRQPPTAPGHCPECV